MIHFKKYINCMSGWFFEIYVQLLNSSRSSSILNLKSACLLWASVFIFHALTHGLSQLVPIHINFTRFRLTQLAFKSLFLYHHYQSVGLWITWCHWFKFSIRCTLMCSTLKLLQNDSEKRSHKCVTIVDI